MGNGDDVIRGCKLWAQLQRDGKVVNSPGHRPDERSAPVGTRFCEVPVLFKQTKQRALPFSAVPTEMGGLSSQRLAAQKIDEVVEDLLNRMDDRTRELYFGGINAAR